jgi:hypothetical protein
MRANEFVSESKIGKLGNRKQMSTIGLHKFRDENCADRTYELNRIMMAAAATDGTFVPDIDGESWAGRYNIAVPYTQEEQDMFKLAAKAVGADYKDLNHGDMESKELDTINTVSTVAKPKRNKYGI